MTSSTTAVAPAATPEEPTIDELVAQAHAGAPKMIEEWSQLLIKASAAEAVEPDLKLEDYQGELLSPLAPEEKMFAHCALHPDVLALFGLIHKIGADPQHIMNKLQARQSEIKPSVHEHRRLLYLLQTLRSIKTAAQRLALWHLPTALAEIQDRTQGLSPAKGENRVVFYTRPESPADAFLKAMLGHE